MPESELTLHETQEVPKSIEFLHNRFIANCLLLKMQYSVVRNGTWDVFTGLL